MGKRFGPEGQALVYVVLGVAALGAATTAVIGYANNARQEARVADLRERYRMLYEDVQLVTRFSAGCVGKVGVLGGDTTNGFDVTLQLPRQGWGGGATTVVVDPSPGATPLADYHMQVNRLKVVNLAQVGSSALPDGSLLFRGDLDLIAQPKDSPTEQVIQFPLAKVTTKGLYFQIAGNAIKTCFSDSDSDALSSSGCAALGGKRRALASGTVCDLPPAMKDSSCGPNQFIQSMTFQGGAQCQNIW